MMDVNEPVDPRRSAAFIELDHIASNFIPLFPPHLKNPIQGNVVDPTLFAAITMAHVYVLLPAGISQSDLTQF